MSDRRTSTTRRAGCLKGGAVAVVVFGLSAGHVAGCNWNADRKAMEAQRDWLPPELNGGEFVAFERCDRFLGGRSYVLLIGAEGMRRWKREGPAIIDRDDWQWRPVSADEIVRKQDWPPIGLSCLSSYEVRGQRLRDHLYRPTTYYRQRGRHGDYIIPSLGVVVGGVDQH